MQKSEKKRQKSVKKCQKVQKSVKKCKKVTQNVPKEYRFVPLFFGIHRRSIVPFAQLSITTVSRTTVSRTTGFFSHEGAKQINFERPTSNVELRTSNFEFVESRQVNSRALNFMV